jgi:hypothetical protein
MPSFLTPQRLSWLLLLVGYYLIVSSLKLPVSNAVLTQNSRLTPDQTQILAISQNLNLVSGVNTTAPTPALTADSIVSFFPQIKESRAQIQQVANSQTKSAPTVRMSPRTKTVVQTPKSTWPSYTLVGSITGRSATLSKNTGELIVVKVGSIVQGWTITQIERDHISVQSQNSPQTQQIYLSK